ncbi:MAG TPA: hypothetical protein VFW22_15730, partial [Pseudolabrys sp.]|nr:hypothetical protein [Pseudolabrys sp.]
MDYVAGVRQLYTKLLGRDADPKGLEFWSSVAAKSRNLDAARLGIMATDEYRDKLGRSQQSELESLAGYNGYSSSDLALLTAFQNPMAQPEPGFVVDFLGSRMRTSSLWTSARDLDGQVLGIPVPGDYHAETIEWIGLLKSVRSAKSRYVAMELGAGLGPWIVAGAAAARSKQITDIRLCAVEADPQHFALMR